VRRIFQFKSLSLGNDQCPDNISTGLQMLPKLAKFSEGKPLPIMENKVFN
jgi:hypothetical protein